MYKKSGTPTIQGAVVRYTVLYLSTTITLSLIGALVVKELGMATVLLTYPYYYGYIALPFSFISLRFKVSWKLFWKAFIAILITCVPVGLVSIEVGIDMLILLIPRPDDYEFHSAVFTALETERSWYFTLLPIMWGLAGGGFVALMRWVHQKWD